MSSIPIDYSNEKMDYLMKKMYLHMLSKEEASELMLLVEKKKQESTDKEYKDVLSGFIEAVYGRKI